MAKRGRKKRNILGLPLTGKDLAKIKIGAKRARKEIGFTEEEKKKMYRYLPKRKPSGTSEERAVYRKKMDKIFKKQIKTEKGKAVAELLKEGMGSIAIIYTLEKKGIIVDEGFVNSLHAKMKLREMLPPTSLEKGHEKARETRKKIFLESLKEPLNKRIVELLQEGKSAMNVNNQLREKGVIKKSELAKIESIEKWLLRCGLLKERVEPSAEEYKAGAIRSRPKKGR